MIFDVPAIVELRQSIRDAAAGRRHQHRHAAGVEPRHEAVAVYLKAGDVVALGIDGLGESRQKVVELRDSTRADGQSPRRSGGDRRACARIISAWPGRRRGLRRRRRANGHSPARSHGRDGRRASRTASRSTRGLRRAPASSPRIVEWERLMKSLQEPSPEATRQWWAEMARVPDDRKEPAVAQWTRCGRPGRFRRSADCGDRRRRDRADRTPARLPAPQVSDRRVCASGRTRRSGRAAVPVAQRSAPWTRRPHLTPCSMWRCPAARSPASAALPRWRAGLIQKPMGEDLAAARHILATMPRASG